MTNNERNFTKVRDYIDHYLSKKIPEVEEVTRLEISSFITQTVLIEIYDQTLYNERRKYSDRLSELRSKLAEKTV